MQKFFRKNQTFVTVLVAIIVATVVIIGQSRQRDKNDATAVEQGNVLVIPEVTIK